MSRVCSRRNVLVLMLCVIAPVATFGFWHETVLGGPAAGRVAIRNEPWLSAPRPPTKDAALNVAEFSPSPVERDPFLTLSQWRVDAPISQARSTSRAAVVPWPELTAVISIDGRPAALLDTLPARPGEKAGAIEVLEIDGTSVLVKRQEGSQWLRLQNP